MSNWFERSLSVKNQTVSDIKYLRKLFSPLKKDITIAEGLVELDLDITKLTCAKVYYNGTAQVLCINKFKINTDTQIREFYNETNKFVS